MVAYWLLAWFGTAKWSIFTATFFPASMMAPSTWDIDHADVPHGGADGITHIVATPHCDGHYEYDREHFTDMLATLSEVSDGRLTFSIGCDFHMSPRNIEAAMDDPRPYAIGDTQYLMVEFDHHGIPTNAGELLRTLLSRGMVPIITHPERNAYLMKHLETVVQIHRDGLPGAGDGQCVHRVLGT